MYVYLYTHNIAYTYNVSDKVEYYYNIIVIDITDWVIWQ